MRVASTSSTIVGEKLPLTFPVYIEAPSIPTASRQVDALLADCSQALKDEECVLGARPTPRERRRALIVVRGPGANSVQIWVYHGDDSASYRELHFGERDAATERWRAAGLVAASMLLVPQATPDLPPEPKHEISTLPPVAIPERARAAHQANAHERFGAWLSGTAGHWAAHAPWTFGAQLGVEGFPLRVPVGASLSLDWSAPLTTLEHAVSVSRQLVAVGLVVEVLQRSGFRVVFRGQVARERLAAAVTAAGASESGVTWRTGGTLALAPTFEFMPGLRAQVGGQLTVYDSKPAIVFAHQPIARASNVAPSAFVGIRAGF